MRSDAQYLLVASFIALVLAAIGTIKAFPSQSVKRFDPVATQARIEQAQGAGEIAALVTTLTALAENRIASFGHWRSTGLSYGAGLLLGLVVDGLLTLGLWRVLQTRWHLSALLFILTLCAATSLVALVVLWRNDSGDALRADLAPLLALDPSHRDTAASLLELASQALRLEVRQRQFLAVWFGALSAVFAAASITSAFAYVHVRRNVTEGTGAVIERI